MRCPLCNVSCSVLGLSALAATAVFLLAAAPQQEKKERGVHDKERPQPAMVEGAGHGSAPSDAIVLFDGKSLDKWTGNGGTAAWEIKSDEHGGYFQVKPGSGNIRTKEGFGSCQLHIEWMVPESCKCAGQQGCNSGVFFMDRYELQILGSNPNKTYVDGMAGAAYGQYPPLVNPCRPQGQWNAYDVVFRAPRFRADGSLESPARLTVFFNGVLVQDDIELLGTTAHKARASYSAHGPGPIRLQDHGDPIRFRNIWVRPLEPRRPAE